jgi:SPP1 family predicted phage head-tail adaptor
MIPTGKMRHFAELQQKNNVADGGGGLTTTWVKTADIWCYIRPISGTQRLENMRRNSSISHEVITRYSSNISTLNRLLFRGMSYNIEAVWSPDEKQEYLHILATEGVAT